MLSAARMYYEDDLSQQQIAERLGVSRSTVSRLLQMAREQGIVHIEIRPPTSASRLSAQLESALKLRRATVVPAPPKGAGLQILVAPALEELGRLTLGREDVLAVSSGATLWEVVRARRFPSLKGVRVVPALGGWDEADVRFQTNEMARRVADASGAEVSFLHAPALPSPDLRRSLLADPDVASRLALWDKLSAALVGIGGPPNERELAPSHILRQRAELAGAVGDVAARHFDLHGQPDRARAGGALRLARAAARRGHGDRRQRRAGQGGGDRRRRAGRARGRRRHRRAHGRGRAGAGEPQVSEAPLAGSKSLTWAASRTSSSGSPAFAALAALEPRDDLRAGAGHLLHAGVARQLVELVGVQLGALDPEVGVELGAHRLDDVQPRAEAHAVDVGVRGVLEVLGPQAGDDVAALGVSTPRGSARRRTASARVRPRAAPARSSSRASR